MDGSEKALYDIACLPREGYFCENTVIHIGRVRPITNVCPVNRSAELINITVDYVPCDWVIELVSYRDRLKQGFSDTLENIAEEVFIEIWGLIKPENLVVTVYLEDEYLSDWHVRLEKGSCP